MNTPILRNIAPIVPVGVRLVVALSLAAGLAFPLLDDRFGLLTDVTLKGSGVAALAVAALLLGRHWLAAIMAAGALGDVLLDLPGLFMAGAGSFAVGHVIAILFYGGERRRGLAIGDRAAAGLLIGYGLAMPALVMPAGTPLAALAPLMLYSVLLCAMAAAALLSRFGRGWTGIGALLFVVSDTLLIMRLGGDLLGGATAHGLMVWYTYYLGQLLIFTGVATARQ